MSRGALMSIFSFVGRPYRPDWQHTYLKDDQGKAGAPPTNGPGRERDCVNQPGDRMSLEGFR